MSPRTIFLAMSALLGAPLQAGQLLGPVPGQGSPLSEPIVRPFVDESGILRGWSWESDGVTLQQVQRLPDQTRAFFQGRGFTADAANRLARACVFQTILRNEGAAPIEVDLADWRIDGGAGSQPLKLTAVWQEEWVQLGVPPKSRIAFRWAMFPNRQTFQPKDWNMGMIAYPLKPGDRFDLQAQWRWNGETVTATLPALECAPDLPAEAMPKLSGDR